MVRTPRIQQPLLQETAYYQIPVTRLILPAKEAAPANESEELQYSNTTDPKGIEMEVNKLEHCCNILTYMSGLCVIL